MGFTPFRGLSRSAWTCLHAFKQAVLLTQTHLTSLNISQNLVTRVLLIHAYLKNGDGWFLRVETKYSPHCKQTANGACWLSMLPLGVTIPSP